jgi:hypothetical protein
LAIWRVRPAACARKQVESNEERLMKSKRAHAEALGSRIPYLPALPAARALTRGAYALFVRRSSAIIQPAVRRPSQPFFASLVRRVARRRWSPVCTAARRPRSTRFASILRHVRGGVSGSS